MDDDDKELLKGAFGDSSDGEDHVDDQQEEDEPCKRPDPMGGDRSLSWEHVEEISGLWLFRNFLRRLDQSSLLSAILDEGWFTEESHNQAMRFGDLPSWATKLSDSIREALESCDPSFDDENKRFHVLPLDLLWREPLFDQLIVNLYQPGEGICAHVDLMRFEDGIAIVSLESPCIMHFSLVEGQDVQFRPMVPVYLDPGSLLVMSGEARYSWKHEINRKPSFQVWDGQELEQSRRISITLRKMCRAD